MDDWGDWQDDDERDTFADPGGRSALRAATGTRCPGCRRRVGRTHDYCPHCGLTLNPRKHACPTCGAPGVLTTRDVALRYQCNRCADAAERGY